MCAIPHSAPQTQFRQRMIKILRNVRLFGITLRRPEKRICGTDSLSLFLSFTVADPISIPPEFSDSAGTGLKEFGLNYYPHHIGDFIRDTSRLNDSQAMAYLRLLWLYYESESPLNNDPETLAFKIGSDSETVQMLLKAFFKLSDSQWHQMRCESEIRKYQKKAESAHRANKARWSEHDLKSDAEQTQTQTQDQIATKNQEPRTINQEPRTSIKPPIAPRKRGASFDSSPETIEVFAHWQSVMGHPNARLDEKRGKSIRNAIKIGYTPAQLCTAINGCKLSPFHMGQNDRAEVYDGLDLILRDAAHIDKFMRLSESNPGGMNLSAVGRQAMSSVEIWLAQEREKDKLNGGSHVTG